MNIRLALPTGDLRRGVGELLSSVGLVAQGYEPDSRVLRSTLADEGLTIRVFREKDIPIQVALGAYDLGICSDAWLAELSIRFPLQRLVRVGSVPGPRQEVWVAASEGAAVEPGRLPRSDLLQGARIVSEFPNFADLLAVHARIPGYRLIGLAGSADAYPPEDAELVLVTGTRESVAQLGLIPLHRLFEGGVALVANADALATKDLSAILGRLAPRFEETGPRIDLPSSYSDRPPRTSSRDVRAIRLALPDGHAQRHTYAALEAAGLRFDGYGEKTFVRRPTTGIDGLECKVIRPQDMAQVVAMGQFDVAVTGVDTLTEHLSRFPASPVELAVDLGRSRYKIGPVVDAALPADTTADALLIWRGLGRPVRIASEYPALAEKFARDHHLASTTIIPISGASEGFVPEDADILVEGSETGASIRANGLKMLDPFMESTNCVIVRKGARHERQELLDELLSKFETAARSVTVS